MRRASEGRRGGAKDSAAVSAMQQAVGMKQEDNLCPSLTWRQRVYGCCGCFATGCVLSFIGWILWQRAPPTRAAAPRRAADLRRLTAARAHHRRHDRLVRHRVHAREHHVALQQLLPLRAAAAARVMRKASDGSRWASTSG